MTKAQLLKELEPYEMDAIVSIEIGKLPDKDSNGFPVSILDGVAGDITRVMDLAAAVTPNKHCTLLVDDPKFIE